MMDYLARLTRRIQHMVRPAKQTMNSIETGVVSKLQCQHNQWEIREINVAQNYGFASATLQGCDLMTINISGDNSAGVVIASNDQAHRPKGMAPGESQMHDNKLQSIYLKTDGSIHISANHEVDITCDTLTHITAPTVLVTGDLHVTGAIIAGFGGGDQVGMQSHSHPQGSDSHGDSEEPTGPPIPGT